VTAPRPLQDAGLCRRCVHARSVASRRSTFLSCGRATTDPAYPRYPRLPVLACPGFEARATEDGVREPIR